jgi:radical SAM superfamily enzyme YgiQ (UPF0313 family)
VISGSLRDPGAILLVSCYELGHQPLGLAWPAAFLERAGFRPACVDLAVEILPEDAVRRARLVVFMVPMHTALRLGVRAAAQVRRVNSAAYVCFCGHYATLNATYLLADLANAVMGGEFEAQLVHLAELLERGDQIEAIGTAPQLTKLEFPTPLRHRLRPLSSYARFEAEGEQRLAGYVEASRGCLHRCLHCPIPAVYGGRFFIVPRDVVLADVRQQVAAGAQHITFGDPDFLNGPGHSLPLARALHAEFPGVTFDFTAKVEHLLRHARLLPEFRALGCAFVVTAVESLSDAVLANLEKGHTRADALRLVGVMRDAGITLRPSLLPFTPWSSLEDYLELLDWVAREDLVLDVDAVQYTVRLLVPPGSLLLGTSQLAPFLGALDESALTYRWTHPDPRMDRLHAEVSSLVAAATRAGLDPWQTFEDVRDLAAATGGGLVAVGGPYNRPLHAGARPPRMTEPWFC